MLGVNFLHTDRLLMQLYGCRHETQIMDSRNNALTSGQFVCFCRQNYVVNFGTLFVCRFWLSISWTLELEKLYDAYYN